MKNPYALILLVAATTAYGQINNPISSLNDLTVRSLTTSEPVTWVLDAMQTNSAPPTSSTLTLPDNANVVRLTNNNTGSGFNYSIQRIANGRLGAFYYLINQSDYPITINNSNGITIQGGTALTLGVNQAATLVATGATNASVAARGDLNDVALGGTANTAPSQTASSGSSLMTRDLTDSNPLWALGSVRTMGAFAFGAFGSGAISGEAMTRGGALLTTGTDTNGYGRASLVQGLNDPSLFSGAGIRFDQTISVSAILSILARSNAVIRLIVGANGSVPAAADTAALAVRGFGVEAVPDGSDFKLRLFAHNGTSYTNSAYTGTIVGYQTHIIISSQTNGVISLYHASSASPKSPPRPSMTPLLTLSGGPTSGAGGAFVDLVAVAASNTATPAQAGVLFYNGMVEVK